MCSLPDLSPDSPHQAEVVHLSIELFHVRFNTVLSRLKIYQQMFEIELELGKLYFQELEDVKQTEPKIRGDATSRMRQQSNGPRSYPELQEQKIIRLHNAANNEVLNNVMKEASRTGRELDELMGMYELHKSRHY
jgi:hypothetical protein